MNFGTFPIALGTAALSLLSQIGQTVDADVLHAIASQSPVLGLLAFIVWMQWKQNEKNREAFELAQDRVNDSLAEHKKATTELAKAVASLAFQLDPLAAKRQAKAILSDIERDTPR